MTAGSGRGGYRPTAGRDADIDRLEKMMIGAGILGEGAGGSGYRAPQDDDPRNSMKLPLPAATTDEFYAQLGCPFRSSKNDEVVTQLAKYQIRTIRNLERHRKLLILKSQKIGLSSLGIVDVLRRALSDCQGYEIVILAQSEDKITEHGRDMKKFLLDSEFADYYIEKQWQNPGRLKDEVSSRYHIYLQNRDLTSITPTHIHMLPPSVGRIGSLKRVKHIWCSDITMVDFVVERQRDYFMTLLSRIVMTEGTIFIECPCVGHLGPIYEKDQEFQDMVKAGIIDPESGEVLKTDKLDPAVAEHMFYVDRIRVQEAIDEGILSKNAIEALKIEHGPVFGAFFEADWYAGDAAWFGPDQLSYESARATDLAEDRMNPMPVMMNENAVGGRRTLPDASEIQLPDPVKFRDSAWFIGLDPAARKNNFGIVVYGLNPKPDRSVPRNGPAGIGTPPTPYWGPFLRDAFDITHFNLTETVQWVQNVIFQAYPPRFCVIDATRDTTVAEEFQNKYGESRCLALKVSNQINYNMFVNAYHVFSERGPGAHAWPVIPKMLDKRKRMVFREYKDQLAHERAAYTDSGRISFPKPPGRQNDVSRAGLMALEAVREFQSGRLGNPDDPVSWGSGGAPTSTILQRSQISRMAAADAEKIKQEAFDREEEETYGRGSSFMQSPP